MFNGTGFSRKRNFKQPNGGEKVQHVINCRVTDKSTNEEILSTSISEYYKEFSFGPAKHDIKKNLNFLRLASKLLEKKSGSICVFRNLHLGIQMTNCQIQIRETFDFFQNLKILKK